jgi:hypothetical protein
MNNISTEHLEILKVLGVTTIKDAEAHIAEENAVERPDPDILAACESFLRVTLPETIQS